MFLKKLEYEVLKEDTGKPKLEQLGKLKRH